MTFSRKLFSKKHLKPLYYYYFFKRQYFLFRHLNRFITPHMWFSKVFLNTGLYSKCFLVLPKHTNTLIGSYKLTRKFYNSSIILKKQKR